MSRKKLTKEDVFTKEPYMSILNLLGQRSKFRDGLEAKHLRYALIKNHDGLHKWTQKTMETFFGSFPLYAFVKKDCITDRKNLNNFLKRLLKLGIITKTKVGTKTKYKMPKEFLNEILRINNKMTLDYYSNKHIINVEAIGETKEESDYYDDVSFLLYGISSKLIDSLLLDKRKKIVENLEKIEELIREIEDMTVFKRSSSHLKEIGVPEDYRCPVITFSRFPKIRALNVDIYI